MTSKIHGLGPVKSEKDKKKDTEEFSGGGYSSSTAVSRPTKRDDSDLSSLVQSAKRHAGSTEAQDANLGIITLYKNGFKIGDGEFRDKKDPENAKFIKELQKGFVPPELEAVARKEWGAISAVRIQLVDKTTEDYVPPKPKFAFKESEGQSLGSSSTAAVTTTASASFASAAPKEYKAKDGEKTTTLQIQLADRKKVKAVFNETATVFDVFQHVMFVSKIRSFALYGGYPPKPLTNPSATLVDEKLLASNIQQRTT